MTPHYTLWRTYIDKGIIGKKEYIKSYKHQIRHSSDSDDEKLLEMCITLFNEELKLNFYRILSFLVIIISLIILVTFTHQGQIMEAVVLFGFMLMGLIGIIFFSIKISKLKKQSHEAPMY